MTSKTNYSEKDWQLLVYAPTFAANSMASIDGSVDNKEVLAVEDAMVDARDAYPDNELIQAVIEGFANMLKETGIPGELRYAKGLSEVMGGFRKIARIVEGNAPAREALEYKQFLVDVIDRVAHASGKKLNLFGDETSESEIDFSTQVKRALGLNN